MKNKVSTDKNIVRTADRELVRRMLDGEESAYREFVGLYKDRLFNTIVGHVGCRHDAEEIVQEAFIKAFQYLPSFQHQSQIYTWIYRIAWNTCASRARKRRVELSIDSTGAEKQSPAPESLEPHVPTERRENIAMLRKALMDIEARHRKILILREFDELSYREIASTLEIPLGTVRSRLARARDRLREELVQVEHRWDTPRSKSPASTSRVQEFSGQSDSQSPSRFAMAAS